jgi:hypothetical protein
MATSMPSARLRGYVFLAAMITASALVSSEAAAQYPPPPPPGYGQPPGPPPPGYGYPGGPGYPPPGPPPKPKRPVSSGLEIGLLYGTAVAWGVGTGIWIDAEAEVEDPGIAIIAPAIFGIAAPVGVFLVDRYGFRRGMPEGLPSAVAAGALIGAGEGLGITGTQWAIAECPGEDTGVGEDENGNPLDDTGGCDEWGFKGLARSEVIGATVGAGAGAGLYYALKPYPESNLLYTSSIFWGTIVGAFFGGGASNGAWGEANDSVSIGGLVGFNVALAGAIGASIFWTPSWNQLGWMWGGFAIGAAAGALVYPFYAAFPDADPRRGLIVQGITATVGLGLGVIFARPLRSPKRYAYTYSEDEDEEEIDQSPIRIIGGGPMAVGEHGVGMQLIGQLW